MNDAPLLKASRAELATAKYLADGGFHGAAISRAYYAAFYAAEQALNAAGETRSKHSGVISGFGAVVVRQGGFPPAVGRLLRLLFERRNDVDYLRTLVGEAESHAAISDAERFVDAVEELLAARPETGES